MAVLCHCILLLQIEDFLNLLFFRKHREDEDSDPHRAKHKRSKRSRKDKEDDGVDSAALSGADENVKVETT